jgi:myo-inositol catabolism protein IolS
MTTDPQPAVDPSIPRLRLGSSPIPLLPMALGGSWYATEVADADLIGAMAAAYDGGLRHFDTAAGYGNGRSEELLGRFLAGKRDSVFLASKANPPELTAPSMRMMIDESLRRLATDRIDLYYIHWPRAGRDMRPVMQGLVEAREQGKIGAIGVSNFSVEQMRQVEEVAAIDAHQLGYNLLWRHTETEIIPYCRRRGIAVIAYSALAHGILTGKYGPKPEIAPGDQRHSILPFRADIWPHVYAGVDTLKGIAADLALPLPTLAIRWILARPGIASVVVGARNRAQSAANLAALAPAISPDAFARMTAISDAIAPHVPDVGNLFNHYP